MLTPILIQVFFWIGTVACVIVGITWIIIGSFGRSFSIVVFLGGLGILVFGPLMLRLICKEAIIFFKIHTELREQTQLARRKRDEF